MRLHHILFAFLLIAPMLAACGGPDEYAVVGTSRAAGAEGEIVVEEIEGGNSLVNINLTHLPPPNRLGDGLTTFVVWFIPTSGTAQKAAVLGYDEDDRTGTATATNPAGRFEIRITAERNGNVNTPSEVVVARQRIGGGDD